jgi:quercetin dioxygenase-like cupin family protein
LKKIIKLKKTKTANLNQLKNGKYAVGRYDHKPKHWFIGDFLEAGHPLKTNQVEIAYIEHEPGFISEPHYHEHKIELIIMLKGRARYHINGKAVMLEKGDFLFVDQNNIIMGEFLAPSKILAIHSPSLPMDKIRTQKKARA